MERAILLASGMGTRMRPLTDTIPKPLIKVGSTPMIETVIEGLIRRGVNQIVIVVGYLGEQFEYLAKKYNQVILIKNSMYETENNISSLYIAREYLIGSNCFICEADLYISDVNVFDKNLDTSVYYGKMIKGLSNDWVFEQDENGVITRVGKVGIDCFNMTGVAYFVQADAEKLHDRIECEYGKKGYEELFWDDVVNKYIHDFELHVEPIVTNQIIEIDTVEELNAVHRMLDKCEA